MHQQRAILVRWEKRRDLEIRMSIVQLKCIASTVLRLSTVDWVKYVAVKEVQKSMMKHIDEDKLKKKRNVRQVRNVHINLQYCPLRCHFRIAIP